MKNRILGFEDETVGGMTMMSRELATELKAAGFPAKHYQYGQKFYPHENTAGRSETTRTVGPYALENHLADIESGYFRPALSDLIGACDGKFSRLFVLKATWFAESDGPELVAMGETPEEAVARLWLALNQHKSTDITSFVHAE
jgi:hypothetical protein